ncbi:MAG: c-type cytochrome [Gallionellaceae bacterium]|jgi:cytochrome c553
MKINKRLISVMGCAVFLSLTTGCATRTVDKHARNMAGSCAACHGTNGHSVGGAPVLAGLDKTYFITQMKDFKSGARQATIMNKHAKGYSDEEFALLADFFAAQK